MDQLRLFELNRLIRDTLDKNLQPAYWVIAEIGEMREAQNGHCYLDLVEKSDDKVIAKIRANIWAYSYRAIASRFESITGESLRSGINVLCQVTVTFHELYGISLNIKDIDASFTLGERARRRQEIIERLKQDGVFEMNKSQVLPLVPQRVAVISSPTAAGYGDFMDQLSHNAFGYRFHTHLYKSTMQGDSAVSSIISSLHQINDVIESYDLVVIIRGGGSQIDLDCFDQYELAAHVAQFPIPVITGIGHDRDETILDLVAHTRVKTPTAAAEFLVSGIRSFEERLLTTYSSISQLANNRVSMEIQRLRTSGHRLENLARQRIASAYRESDKVKAGLRHAALKRMANEKERLALARKSLSLLDPDRILRRGYTITRLNGKAIGTAIPAQGDQLETITSEGQINSTVTEAMRNDERE